MQQTDSLADGCLGVNQDTLGVQAQRVWSKGPRGGSLSAGGGSAAAVAAPCDSTRPTQTWTRQ